MKSIKAELKSYILKKLNVNNCFVDKSGEYYHVTNLFNVKCCVCEKDLIAFLPYRYEPHQACPSCSSLPRHRLLWNYLLSHSYLERQLRVLHIAPEKVLYQKFKRNSNWDYSSGDLFPGNYFADTIAIDLMNMSFEDNSFDLILCNHVLEHVDNDFRAMEEFKRILSVNGEALIMVPIFNGNNPTFEDPNIIEPEKRLQYYGQEDHVRAYGADVLERFQKPGFNVQRISHYCNFSVTERFINGFNSNDEIFKLKK
jgi:SAM-dependent methyltransferase